MSRHVQFVFALLFGALTVGCGPAGDDVSLPESTAAELDAQLAKPGLVLAKFGAPWCPPCREVDRELAKLTAMSDVPADVVLINVDDEPGLSKKYKISSIPRIMIFRDGQQVKDHVGYAGLDDMREWITAAANKGDASEIQTNPHTES